MVATAAASGCGLVADEPATSATFRDADPADPAEVADADDERGAMLRSQEPARAAAPSTTPAEGQPPIGSTDENGGRTPGAGTGASVPGAAVPSPTVPGQLTPSTGPAQALDDPPGPAGGPVDSDLAVVRKEWGLVLYQEPPPSHRPECVAAWSFMDELVRLARSPAEPWSREAYVLRTEAVRASARALRAVDDALLSSSAGTAEAALGAFASSLSSDDSWDAVRTLGDVMLSRQGGVEPALSAVTIRCPFVATGVPSVPKFWLN